ncbi:MULTISPECIES: TfpX/TfpZ family type IV pilin accessory protein [unclassified Simplicispira]|uniref:TfpX/TfpZ family type IV pilin accessory protein n=1 Tax=unclassified Simplicispira TaxID=2630407 RepID=UPI000D5C446F|nr:MULTISPECIES: TfpX/TfpZ family type IV pilin accessory protein [unclassified Simplicispira]PVY57375.1 hypothetical protein C8D04_2659 [Simplicispira sp. 125]REG18320.1 hypothetical protein C8D01_2969 [Simplicispira sp. 110]
MTAIRYWKQRLRASAIHLGISLCAATMAAVLVFWLWYPYPYREISGGRSLFILVVAVDIIVGPLVTLIIFNKNKPRRELVSDFMIIGALQVLALGYGLWTVFVARPVYLVYEYDRLSVVHAVDINDGILSKAPPSLQKLPVTGPSLIALRKFKNASEQFDATMQALAGIPLSARSDLWQPYASRTGDVLKSARPVKNLRERFASQAALIDQAISETGRSVDSLRYLPMVDREKVWTVLIDAENAEPLGYFPLDSF